MKTILVTGGCGFIMSNLIRLLLKKDYKIINLDALTYAGRMENTEDFKDNKNYQFVKGNICDKTVVEELVKKSDIVVNGAAETHVDRSIIDAGSFVLTDVFGTYTLLEACRKFGIEKFVHISTDEVYGSRKKGSFEENDKLEPNSPYSASKAGADLLVRAYQVTHKLPIVITRSSNNYGPFQYPEKIIPLFITNLLLGKKVPLYGDGLNVRDWLYVMDNCRAIELIITKGKTGEIYNIASGQELTNLELTKKLLKMLGKDENDIEFVQDRKGHDFRYSIDTEKIRKLGWSTETAIDNGLKETVDWYKNNENWWRPLI